MTESATIAAICTPPGAGERGAIRISGPDAGALVAATFRGPEGEPRLGERGLHRGRFADGRGTQPALLLWMPGPRSYTGEDVAELHLPGAPPLLAAALERLLASGARAAGPGEFTRRAFLNGRIDLTRAEGVLELVEASNEQERRAATALLAGGLERRVLELREGLDELRGLCEASLDFDEAETGHVPTDELLALAAPVRAGLRAAASWELRRDPPSGAPRIVLAGAPNAGKSSLFNALTGAGPAGAPALVSDLAGTTRDFLTAAWTVAGVECVLSDSAGLDAEAAGAGSRAQELGARERAAADLVLWVVDAAADPSAEAPAPAAGSAVLVVHNKLDLLSSNTSEPAGSSGQARSSRPAGSPPGSVEVSARLGTGLDRLAALVADRLHLSERVPGAGPGPGGSLARELSLRHRAALEGAAARLERALAELAQGAPLDLVAETFRAATHELDAITGRTSPEDLLDRIFGRFCIGK